jgi:poly-gamma-glutamate synthesis protein (capsule biosynthesis protein)
VGDLCNERVSQPRAFDEPFVQLIRSADVSVANLEAPVTDRPAPSAKSGPSLSLTTPQATVLTGAGFGLFGIANNHLFDHGLDGLTSTLEFLRSVGINGVGAGRTEADAYVPVVLDLGHVRVAVLAACEREFGVAEEGRGGVAAIDHPRFANALVQARSAADVLVVMAHGGVELSWVPPTHWAEQVRRLVDAGADVVVGHHPHVVQGIERYGRGLIAYSLGDCYWPRSGGADDPRRAVGLALEVAFDGARLERFTARPLGLTHDYRLRLLVGEEEAAASAIIARLSRLLVDRDVAAHLWETLAVKFYADRHQSRLFGSSRGAVRVRDLARYAAVGLQNFGSSLAGRPSRGTLRRQQLYLLNLLQNPSHRDVCIRGLQGLVSSAESPEQRAALEEIDAIDREMTALGRAVAQTGAAAG